MSKPLDLDTLDAAEKVVRDRIRKTRWASDARLLKLVADEIHCLRDTQTAASIRPESIESATPRKDA